MEVYARKRWSVIYLVKEFNLYEDLLKNGSSNYSTGKQKSFKYCFLVF